MNFRKYANHRQRKADRTALRSLPRARTLDESVETCEMRIDRHEHRASRDKQRWAA